MGIFKDYLDSLGESNNLERMLESPVKISGDAPFETLNGRNKSIKALKEDFIKIGSIDNLDVYKHNNLDYIIVGDVYMDNLIGDERFGIIAELSYTIDKIKSSNKLINGKEAIKIPTIQVKETHRRDKIASRLYLLLLDRYVVISDGVQYKGAVALWKSFVEIPGIKLYIYDIIEDKIISKMTAITHDNSIWSNGDLGDYSKNKVRLILSL